MPVTVFVEAEFFKKSCLNELIRFKYLYKRDVSSLLYTIYKVYFLPVCHRTPHTKPWKISTKKKVKRSRYRLGVAQRVGRGIALLFHDRGTRRGEWPAARPGRTLPPGKTRYPLYRRLGGPQDRSERAENLVPTGTRSRTVQRVVSRYTNWATGPTKDIHIYGNLRLLQLLQLFQIFGCRCFV